MSRLVLVSCESHGLVSWLMERLLEFLASDRTDCCCTGLQTPGRSVTLRSRSQTYNSMARPLNFKNLTFQIFFFCLLVGDLYFLFFFCARPTTTCLCSLLSDLGRGATGSDFHCFVPFLTFLFAIGGQVCGHCYEKFDHHGRRLKHEQACAVRQHFCQVLGCNGRFVNAASLK